jgi:hypothetical protein
MANERNPYDDGIFPDTPAPQSAAEVNPYDILSAPIGPDTSAMVRPGDKPYSTFNTVGRMATDALLGIPDTITMLQHGAKAGFNRGLDYLTGETPPQARPRGLSDLITGQSGPDPSASRIPYLAPMLRKPLGIAELPEDAGLGRSLAEGVGSAVVGGVGSATSRALARGVSALPEVISSFNPYRSIKGVTEDALAKSGDNWYKALDNLDVRYTQQTGPHMATAIDRGAFKPRGINENNAGQVINNVEQLRAIDPAANVPYGTTKDYIVPRDIEDVRQALGKTRADAARTPGSGHREGQAANLAIEGIDKFFQNTPKSAIHPSSLSDPSLVGPVLSNARADTAAAHRLGFLEGTRDELGTKFAAKPGSSASNEAQGLRDRAAAALNASREGGGPLYGFNDYEKQLLDKVATASWLSRYGANAPKSLPGVILQAGSAGFGSHMMGLPPSVSATIAAAIPGTEYVAKKLGDWGTRRAYDRATEAIAARSPLAQSMGIPAPPTAMLPAASRIGRDDIAAALMAQQGKVSGYVDPLPRVVIDTPRKDEEQP